MQYIVSKPGALYQSFGSYFRKQNNFVYIYILSNFNFNQHHSLRVLRISLSSEFPPFWNREDDRSLIDIKDVFFVS